MFEVFEPVLARLNAEGQREFGTDWIPRLARRRETFKTSYAALDEPDRDPIVYSALTAQTAYIFAYAPTRAEYARQFLLCHRKNLARPLFNAGELEVVSFGGGPASELVGLVRYLEDDGTGEAVTSIRHTVYDKDGEWGDVAEAAVKSLETEIEIEMEYVELDVSNARSMRAIDLSHTSLVIFSYIMSELCKLSSANAIAENFRITLAALAPGSEILFIDNLHPLFIEYFRACKLVSGLRQKSDCDDVQFNCPKLTGTFATLSTSLSWLPRTDLRAVSKLIVREAT